MPPFSGTNTTGTYATTYTVDEHSDLLHTRFMYPYTIDASNTWATSVSPTFHNWEISTTDLIECIQKTNRLEKALEDLPKKIYKTISEHIALDLSEEEFIQMLMEGE